MADRLLGRAVEGLRKRFGAESGETAEDPSEPEEETVPDYQDRELLERLYDEHDGTITDLYRAHDFDVSQGTVRNWLINYEVHKVDSYESPEPEQRESTDDAREWCGVCGAGPYQSVARHSGHVGHPRTIALDHEPTEHEVAQMEDLAGDSAEVSDFHDVETPDWLDEASFYQAVDMAVDLEDLQNTLGWEDIHRLEVVVDLLDVEEDVHESTVVPADGGDRE